MIIKKLNINYCFVRDETLFVLRGKLCHVHRVISNANNTNIIICNQIFFLRSDIQNFYIDDENNPKYVQEPYLKFATQLFKNTWKAFNNHQEHVFLIKAPGLPTLVTTQQAIKILQWCGFSSEIFENHIEPNESLESYYSSERSKKLQMLLSGKR